MMVSLKFSNSSRTIFQQFLKKYVDYKKVNANEYVQSNVDTVKPEESYELNQLEIMVRDKLMKNNINIIEKFRKFPLEMDGEKLEDYEPDFFLPDHTYKKRDNKIKIKKTILIEVHESFTGIDISKHIAFMRKYGGQYHLILIVNEKHMKKLEDLNQFDKICDKIYPIGNMDFLINELERYKTNKYDNEQIKEESESQNQLPPRIMECTGCGKEFTSNQYNRVYCDECMAIFEN